MNASQGRKLSQTPEYEAWLNMRRRVKQAPYVDRGIKVCDRWQEFANFLEDMGERPEGLSLGRLDKDGDFEPGNCRWMAWAAAMKGRSVNSASLANLRPGDGSHTVTHGDTGTPEFNAWRNLRARCNNPGHQSYSYYGARGIKVCDRWNDSYENFLADMGRRPGPGYSIERIDNDGPYSPENCRWATRGEQRRNTRQTRLLTYNGKTQCVKDWAAEFGLSDDTLLRRLELGWPIREALTLSPQPRRQPRKRWAQ